MPWYGQRCSLPSGRLQRVCAYDSRSVMTNGLRPRQQKNKGLHHLEQNRPCSDYKHPRIAVRCVADLPVHPSRSRVSELLPCLLGAQCKAPKAPAHMRKRWPALLMTAARTSAPTDSACVTLRVGHLCATTRGPQQRLEQSGDK